MTNSEYVEVRLPKLKHYVLTLVLILIALSLIMTTVCNALSGL